MNRDQIDLDDRQNRFELKTLLETSRLLIESHDVEFVLSNLLLIIMGKLLITRGAILLHLPDQDSYKVARSKGRVDLKEDDILEIPDCDCVHGETFLEYSGNPEEFPDSLAKFGYRIILNLRTSEQHIGLLCLGSKANGKKFTLREKNFVESLSIMASVAINNSELFSELKQTNRQLDRKVQELHTLFDISKEFNITTDRNQILRTFKFALMGQMFIRSFFFIMDRNNKHSIIARNGLKSEPGHKVVSDIFNLPVDVIEVDDELAKQQPFLKENNIELLIPLHVQNQKIAVIGVGQRANKEPYTESDFNFLISLGNLSVVSIQKTYLLEERIEKERLEKELGIARTIQQGLFPSSIPGIEGIKIAAQNIPSQQVGGDYYDVIPVNDQLYYLAIGDVTGKGIPASLIMANIQAVLQTLAPLDLSIEEKTARINDIIYRNTPADKFVTFFWAKIDPKKNLFSYVNAGHNPPLLFKSNQIKPIHLDKGGLILGAMPTLSAYLKEDISLEKDDLIVFYTDGVTEARNTKDEELEEDGLIECINRHRSLSADELITAVIDDVKSFSDNQLGDDLTMLVLTVS